MKRQGNPAGDQQIFDVWKGDRGTVTMGSMTRV
ncbi:hypothetical protein DEA8626_03068 [Defluviimonas aquaemixtae]|uniref:Uncharacterized protein n=1 Tax=Albidovulum aquaemixtae TaxID=1542388 RepID=A0A2R8BKR7_9RHOB|nr:hypothetical protein DEA8626_03068 [Defluviimonas aquaemixtae]